MQLLESGNIQVNDLVRTVYCLPAELLQDFLVKYAKEFRHPDTISKVFFRLSEHKYWDYLNFDILDHIITEFSLPSQTQLKDYKRQWQQFMEQTTVEEFYEAEESQLIHPPPAFVELITQHKWKPPTSLERVDKFRKTFAHKYDLCDSVVILMSAECCLVVITMLVPESVMTMVNPTGIEFFKEHAIVHLQLNGTYVYKEASPCYGYLLQ